MKFLRSKEFWYRVLFTIGVWLFIGAILLKSNYGEEYSKIASACTGLGILVIGFCSFMLSRHGATQNNPDLLRKQKIEEHDERNIFIREKAFAKANIILIGLISATLFGFSFFDVAWYIPVTLGAFLLVNGVSFFLYYLYYNKRL